MSLNDLLKLHKETVLFGEGGFPADCILKPTAGHEGGNELSASADAPASAFKVKGFSSFIGVTFDENQAGYFGDSFEITINLDELAKKTDLIPTKGWGITAYFPQMNGKAVNFIAESVAIDRTLGMCLFKCSASTSQGEGKVVKRQASGGM